MELRSFQTSQERAVESCACDPPRMESAESSCSLFLRNENCRESFETFHETSKAKEIQDTSPTVALILACTMLCLVCWTRGARGPASRKVGSAKLSCEKQPTRHALSDILCTVYSTISINYCLRRHTWYAKPTGKAVANSFQISSWAALLDKLERS